MHASIQGFIEGLFLPKRQYKIPVYQRNYDWGIKQCKELYMDIINAANIQKPHFLGTFVQYQLKAEYNIKDIPIYIIIDGQQRFTTVYLFLKALYDLVPDSPTKNDILSKLFNLSTIINYEINEKLKLKLKAVKNDDKQLKLLMDDDLENINKNSNIYNNYVYFKQLIKNQIKKGQLIEQFIYGLSLLRINIIELDISTDDPQIIFDRINSTGKPLDLKDQVRNYLLMNEPDMERLFEFYWEPTETLLNVENINEYISSFLLYKINDTTSQKIDYYAFKKYAENKKNEDILYDLKHLSKYYNAFIKEDISYGKEINEILNYFKLLKHGTIYVLFYDIFNDYEKEIISKDTLIKTLKFFLNYAIRRLIISVKSGSLRGFYKSLYKRVFNNQTLKNNDNYYNAIISFMSKQYTSDKVPNDDQFLEKLKEFPVYKQSNLARILLCICENGFNEKELVHINDDITIEHILPQNKNNKWWNEHIGLNYEITYIKYIHTIGNLTLSGHNSKLGDKSFNEKVKIIKENSKFQILNRDIINQSIWREEQIINRATNISNIIINRLSLPDIFNNNRINNTSITTEHTLYDDYDYTNEKILYFTFQETSVVVDSTRDFFIKSLELLYNYNKVYFSEFMKENSKIINFNSKELREPKQILDTNIFVETNFSSNRTINILKKVYECFNLAPEELLFYTESK